MAATTGMRTIPIFFKKGRGSRWRGSGSLRRFRLDLPCLRHRLKRWGETRLAPERRSVVGFYPMAMLTSAIHIYRRLPGESIRLRPDPTTPSPPLNPRPPLIPNSEKKNLREAFAGSSLEVLPGYPGVSMRPSGRCPIWRGSFPPTRSRRHPGGSRSGRALGGESISRPGPPGMEARAGVVGGTFKIKSWPGGKTIVVVEFPLTDVFAEIEPGRSPLSPPSLT